jgi:hypothetical protein
MNSASLCSLAGRYENPIPPRCLAPIDFLKIPAQQGFILGTRTKGGRGGWEEINKLEGDKWGVRISSAERITNCASIENLFPDLTGIIVFFSFLVLSYLSF